MERISLANLHEQLDSITTHSIPQVKRYFRKRIVKCLTECKQQARNMKKSIESSSSSSQPDALNQSEYECGWGSDFDEDDEDDEELGRLANKDSTNRRADVDIIQSLSNCNVNETSTSSSSRCQTQQLRQHSVSLQSFDCIDSSAIRSSKWSCWSSPSTSIRRPQSSPPPPPLPKEPPPSSQIHTCTTVMENSYEVMSPSADCDDEYLLPNSVLRSSHDEYIREEDNINYEYIQYSQVESASQVTAATASEQSRSNSFNDLQTVKQQNSEQIISDRPLPPIPAEDIFDNLLHNFSWFHDLERDEAERMLKKLSVDGVYLVRKSRRAGQSSPYTLTLFYGGRIFHLNVRKRSDGQYALGKEKHKEKTFASVTELIDHHNKEPIFLTSKGQAAGKTRLLYTPSSPPT